MKVCHQMLSVRCFFPGRLCQRVFPAAALQDFLGESAIPWLSVKLRLHRACKLTLGKASSDNCNITGKSTFKRSHAAKGHLPTSHPHGVSAENLHYNRLLHLPYFLASLEFYRTLHICYLLVILWGTTFVIFHH